MGPTKPMRDLFDALRMIVYRAEIRLAAALARDRNRLETGRTLVKAVLFSDAGIVPRPLAETLTVWLLDQTRSGKRPRTGSSAGRTKPDHDSLPVPNLRRLYEILPDDPGAKGKSASGSAGPSRQGELVTPLARLVHNQNHFGEHRIR